MRLFASLVCLLAITAAAPAQAKKEPLVIQVKTAIDSGVRQLKGLQMADGSFERAVPLSVQVPGGCTAMAVLALLNAGVPVEDAHVKQGLAYLRKLEPGKTYVRALQTPRP